MYWPLLAMAVLSAALVGGVTWICARRYGRRLALTIPFLALGAVAFLLWRASGTGSHHALGISMYTMTLAGPGVAGALIGLWLSRRSRD